MNKQVILYAVIFVTLFTLASAIIYFLFGSKLLAPDGQPEATADTAAVAAAVADTTQPEPQDSLAVMRPDTLEVAKMELPDPLVEYNNLMLLRKRLIEFYSNGEIRAYSNSEIDSVFTGFVQQIDSLAYKQQRYIAKINALNRKAQRAQVDVDLLRDQVAQLQEEISTLEQKHTEEIATLTTGDDQKLVQDAADMWQNMQPANAAQSLLPLTDSEIIVILRNMNTRRASKILDQMPDARAASLLRTMSNP